MDPPECMTVDKCDDFFSHLVANADVADMKISERFAYEFDQTAWLIAMIEGIS